MKKYRIVITLLMLSMMSLTAIAQTNLSPLGCRRGTPRQQSIHPTRGGNKDRIPGGDYYHGERHQLAILVAFNDRTFAGDKEATLEQWDKIFNTKDFAEEPYVGSVHDYFMAQSYGRFNVVFDLLYIQVSGNAEKYASTEEDDENSQYLVEDVVDTLRTLDIDWSKYDWNGDGNVNQLLIVYAGKGMNDSSDPDLIWPHQWWMSEHLKDREEDVYCEALTVSSGGKDYLVDCYCALSEMRKNGSLSSFGIICHEYTHCFGFPDFYGYSNKNAADTWDLMDYGNYNGNGFRPACYSAHERWLMGWLTPIELNSTTSISNMPALADEGVAYLIRNDGCENEYYIVENRQKTGWDASIPGNGVIIYHIDYDPSIWTSTTTATNSSKRMRYEIFKANNLNYSSRGWAYPYEDNDSLTNTSTPAATLNNINIDGTKLMSKPITNISVTGGLASFDFSTTPTPTGINEATTRHDKLLYRFCMIDIIRDTKGNIRKVIRK